MIAPRKDGVDFSRKGRKERKENARLKPRFLWGAAVLALGILIVGGICLWRGGEEGETVNSTTRKGETHRGGDGANEEIVRAATERGGGVDATSAPLPTEEQATEPVPPKPKKKFRIIKRDANKKKLFHNIADIYISRLVNSQPGNLIVGTINYDRFPEQFRRALETPITIDEDDTEEDVAKKQAVIETRAELKKMLDDGVDISEVMREAESEMRRLWNYRRALHLELAKAMQERRFNADDMQDYVDAANIMLKDNGMAPLKHPEFWVRRMRREEAGAGN